MIMTELVNLIIPFIALAVLSVMIDKFTLFLEGIMHKIPGLPDKLEWWMAYVLVLIFSTVVCWQGDFRFFDYLNLYFTNWVDYIMTGLVISGGSAFVRTQFGMIDSIPTAVMGVTTSFTRMLSRGNKKQVDNVPNDNVVEPIVPMDGGGYYPSVTPSTDAYPPAVDSTVIDQTQGETNIPIQGDTNYQDSNRYSDDI